MPAPVVPLVTRLGIPLASRIMRMLGKTPGVLGKDVFGPPLSAGAARRAARRAAINAAKKYTKYPAKAEMFGRKYGPGTLGVLGTVGGGLATIDMVSSFLGGAEEGLGANTPQPMTDDDAMALLDQQLMQGRQNVFEEDILGPISKGIERTAREFGRVPSNLTSTLDDLATSNFVGQRANRLAQLSQPMGDSPSLIEIAHRLGLPIE